MTHNQNNDFQQYGFDHYGHNALPQGGKLERLFGPRAARVLKSPLVATVAFLLVGAAFAGVILSGSSGSQTEREAPLVKAEQFVYKERPSDSGDEAMSRPDNAIYLSMRGEDAREAAPIENLLEDEAPIDKLQSFARQVEDIAKQEESVPVPAKKPEATEQKTPQKTEAPDQKSGSVQPSEHKTPEPVTQAAQRVEPPKMPMTHQPGSSPETLEFVRSVLDKKDGRVAAEAMATRDHTASDVASGMAQAKIEPSAGRQLGAVGITPGNHFVQLGSVRNASGAEGEWIKLQKTFPEQLSGMEHRVTTANLGERGIYYRIQAGPMSRDSAVALCEDIKAQKPGGCLVTQ